MKRLRLAATALFVVTACSDGDQFPVECRSNADCAVGNCIETICTGGGTGGPSLLPTTDPGTEIVEVSEAPISDVVSVDAADTADAGETSDGDDASAQVACGDLVVSPATLSVEQSGSTVTLQNTAAGAVVVSIVNAVPRSAFVVTAPAAVALPSQLLPGDSLSVRVESIPGESATGLLELVTDVCLVSVPLSTP